MIVQCHWTALLVLGASCSLATSVYAGSPTVEADTCSRWLDAFAHDRLDEAVSISVEQLRPGDVPDFYVKAQRDSVDRVYTLVSRIGAGPPEHEAPLDDALVQQTGDIIKRQVWQFSNGARAYVGCVSYPGRDAPWHLNVKFEDNLQTLTTKLTDAAQSNLASPPERN